MLYLVREIVTIRNRLIATTKIVLETSHLRFLITTTLAIQSH